MESSRLFLVPQLPIHLRYQEWWLFEMVRNLMAHFEVVVLGQTDTTPTGEAAGFSHVNLSIANELQQVQEYLDLKPTRDDVLLLCDLSFPGIFSSVLFLKDFPGRKVAICHATSKNHLDIFAGVKCAKWDVETGHAWMYDKVLVATKYHRNKLHAWSNVVVMGALPNPPEYLLPPDWQVKRDLYFGSVSRLCPQKTDTAVEDALEHLSGHRIHKQSPDVNRTWKDYYSFLDRTRYLIITSQEETYGYQIVDAVLRGCIPIAPYSYSYPELLSTEHLYHGRGATPVMKAARIRRIVRRFDITKTIPKLICQEAIDGFWKRLVKELKE